LKQDGIFITSEFIDLSSMAAIKKTNDRLRQWLSDETALDIKKVLTPKLITDIDSKNSDDAFKRFDQPTFTYYKQEQQEPQEWAA
jgi:hypothetical protein